MKTRDYANSLRVGGLIFILIAAEILGALSGWVVGPITIAAIVAVFVGVVAWSAVTAGVFFTIGQLGQIEQIGYDEAELDPR